MEQIIEILQQSKKEHNSNLKKELESYKLQLTSSNLKLNNLILFLNCNNNKLNNYNHKLLEIIKYI